MTTDLAPKAFHVDEACRVARVGKTRLYEAIGAGELAAKKCGKRTLILSADLERWLAALPNVATPRAA